jgi:hypothetical protein
MHIVDLDANISTSKGGKWNPSVIITILDDSGLPVARRVGFRGRTFRPLQSSAHIVNGGA